MQTPLPDERIITWLRRIIHVAVRALALLMTIVIVFGVLDVGWVLYQKLTAAPFMLLTISDILATFGAFMAVLIAIEIFENIIIYLREDIIHVKIVMATALMAIARKVIILDFKTTEPAYIYATAAVVLAMSIGYWLVLRGGNTHHESLLGEGEPETAPPPARRRKPAAEG